VKILVLNAGSSSVKYQLFNMTNNAVLASGIIEQIGEKESMAKIKYKDSNDVEQKKEEKCSIKDHDEALKWMSEALIQSGVIHDLNELDGIGHRVVQGGASFQEPAMVNEYVMSEIERLIPLGPLHNPGHLAGMKVSVHQSPNVPQVAIFSTVALITGKISSSFEGSVFKISASSYGML
jgi:acetate kinase